MSLRPCLNIPHLIFIESHLRHILAKGNKSRSADGLWSIEEKSLNFDLEQLQYSLSGAYISLRNLQQHYYLIIDKAK